MTTISHVPGYRASRAAAYSDRSPRTRSIGLELVGLVVFVASAWGGIIPFVGPAFGFNATGQPSWHWDLGQAMLGLVPGAVGVVVGLSLMAPSVTTVGWRRLGMTTAGVLGIAAGCWFVIGPFAWPVLTSDTYFVPGSTALDSLSHLIGYALGPGLILAMGGAYTLGWATRHDRPLAAYGDAGAPYGGASGQVAGGRVAGEPGPGWAANPAAPAAETTAPPRAPAVQPGEVPRAPAAPQAPARPGGPPERPVAPPFREEGAPPMEGSGTVGEATAPPSDPSPRAGYDPTGHDPTGYEAGYEGRPPTGPGAPKSPAA